MLLKYIKIKDFRQFAGQQAPIMFSTDLEKNVTVIMGENGSGKTTLAQAFTWCLYGATDFDDKEVLCKATAVSMLPNEPCKVRVEINLEHSGITYNVIREQIYEKDGTGKMKRPKNAVLKVAYKGKDGQQEFVKDIDTEAKINEILPKDLSKYFFFDGERIGNMSKEIRKGKSDEFARAVKSLLGLSAFVSALEHLNGRSPYCVIKSYTKNFNDSANSKVGELTKMIAESEAEIEKIDTRLAQIKEEIEVIKERIETLKVRILENSNSKVLAARKKELSNKLSTAMQMKKQTSRSLFDTFNKNAPLNFAKKMIFDALTQLSAEEKLDKGIPDIHQRTIEFLISRGKCICGHDIEFNSVEYKALMEIVNYIPPQSIGSLISTFATQCELKTKSSETLFDNISMNFSQLLDYENVIVENQDEIEKIEVALEGLEDVGFLQKKLSQYEATLRFRNNERDDLNRKKGVITEKISHNNSSLNELALKDEQNRKVAIYKAYAQYIFDVIAKDYKANEIRVRNELKSTINEIFSSIYDGGIELDIDEKYNVQVKVNDFAGYINDVETSTAQSISVIFAFIAGVIKMARDSQKEGNEMLVSESYPLVMDAPLSAFDKERIKTICEALPKVSEQVIIFIKDTDGELAETYMQSKLGKRYILDKKNELETYVVER